MEKEKLFVSEGVSNPNEAQPTWNSRGFGMDMQSRDVNCGKEQLGNCFFHPNWNNAMDQSDPFESAMSSMVSSPVASNAGNIHGGCAAGGGGDSVVLGELIGRLGNICNSGEISPDSYINGNKNNRSCNTTCYSTPLSSPPKLSLSMVDSQIGGRNFPIPVSNLRGEPNLVPFAADPGFVDRAARFSCFGGLTPEFRSIPRIEPDNLSRASCNQPIKVSGFQVMESNRSSSAQDVNSGSDKKFTPENAEFGDSRENSSVSEQIPVGESNLKNQYGANSRKRKSIPKGKAVKQTPASSSSSPCDAKIAVENNELNTKRSKQDEATKANMESNGNDEKHTKENSKPPEPPKDYIHVRARRGQATDSHSLAERVRREKISERMKFLQDLVPGCNKVTGKAVMLDEIINYVQSLQRQVEFLSMKLATVNPKMDINMNALLSKEMLQSNGSFPSSLYPLDVSPQGFPFGYQSQQGLPFNSSEAQFAMNPINVALLRNLGMQLPLLDGFGDVIPQNGMFWEDDLQSVVQMGFGQNHSESDHGSIGAGSQMKVEL